MESQLWELSISAETMITPQLELGSRVQAPLEQICTLEQGLHGAPPEPQALSLVPDRHWLPLQQPGQLEGPHCALLTQVPCWQLSPLWQASQVCPPAPQAVSLVPVWHTDPAQHPLQTWALQSSEPLQLPSTQLSPGLHLVHAAPPEPQAVGSVPERQTPFSQQPLQLPGPQPQLWLSHCWLAAQLMQGIPPVPQASLAVPGRQASPSQQPSGQLEGLHVPVDWMHWPWAQNSGCWHTTQGRPAAPQAPFSVPTRQTLPTQQPGQVSGEQTPPSGTKPASSAGVSSPQEMSTAATTQSRWVRTADPPSERAAPAGDTVPHRCEDRNCLLPRRRLGNTFARWPSSSASVA
jgi:hypothetical protein